MNHPRRFTFIVLFTASSTLAGSVSILVLSPAGRVAQRLRGEGDGPGELRRPTQMQVVDDRLYVLDGSRRRLAVFSIRDGLKPETDLAIPDPNARAFCAMGNAVHFLHGTADAVRSTERVGNTLVPRGTLARFEADHPLAANPMFTATMSFRGYLACFPKANRVLWVNIILGDVAAMTSAGEPPRRARLQAFSPATIGLRGDVHATPVRDSDELELVLRGSPAIRFVEDPEAFLRRVSLGGHEDA